MSLPASRASNQPQQQHRFHTDELESSSEHTPLTALFKDLCELYGDNAKMQINLAICVFLMVLTSVFEYAQGRHNAALAGCCRALAVLAFFAMNEKISLPFQTSNFQPEFRSRLLPYLTNGILRIVSQGITAYLCASNALMAAQISTLWIVLTLYEVFTSLDLRAYDKVLTLHQNSNALPGMKTQKKEYLEDQTTLERHLPILETIVQGYFSVQYLLYAANALGIPQSSATVAHWSESAISTLLIVTLLYFRFCFSTHLANRPWFLRSCYSWFQLIQTHVLLYLALASCPSTQTYLIVAFELKPAVFLIIFLGWLMLLSIVLQEVKVVDWWSMVRDLAGKMNLQGQLKSIAEDIGALPAEGSEQLEQQEQQLLTSNSETINAPYGVDSNESANKIKVDNKVPERTVSSISSSRVALDDVQRSSDTRITSGTAIDAAVEQETSNSDDPTEKPTAPLLDEKSEATAVHVAKYEPRVHKALFCYAPTLILSDAPLIDTANNDHNGGQIYPLLAVCRHWGGLVVISVAVMWCQNPWWYILCLPARDTVNSIKDQLWIYVVQRFRRTTTTTATTTATATTSKTKKQN
jgi:hypothetical protein